jgi:hypothetical protein
VSYKVHAPSTSTPFFTPSSLDNGFILISTVPSERKLREIRSQMLAHSRVSKNFHQRLIEGSRKLRPYENCAWTIKIWWLTFWHMVSNLQSLFVRAFYLWSFHTLGNTVNFIYKISRKLLVRWAPNPNVSIMIEAEAEQKNTSA